MNEELKPCPFCGADAVLVPGNGWPGEVVVQCSNSEGCRASMSDIWGTATAAELWNRRTNQNDVHTESN